MSINRFEDLIAWQKAMDLGARIYQLSRQAPLSKDFVLIDQLRRAAISIPSNIAEGFERRSPAEFHRFLGIAKGSCAELRTQVELARRIGYLDDAIAIDTLDRSHEVSRIIGKLRSTVAIRRPSTRNSELGTRN